MLALVKTKLNDTEKRLVADLLAKSFSSNNNEMKNHFNKKLENAPGKTFILVQNDNSLVGVLLLVDRVMNYCGVPLSACGMSYMATDPAVKSLSASKLIKEKLFELWDTKVISLGFARKAMDGYWYPYGFLGFTDFGEMKFFLKSIKMPEPHGKITIEPIVHNDIMAVDMLYTTSYQSLIGNLVRNKEQWLHIIDKSIDLESVLLKICLNEKIIGYFYYQDNRILELGCREPDRGLMLSCIKSFFNNKKFDEIIFNINLNHPFLKFFENMSHSQTQRFVFEGGHILRINKVPVFFESIHPVLEKRLQSNNLKRFSTEFEGIHFNYDGHKLSIEYDNEFEENDNLRRDLTHLVFGMTDQNDLSKRILFPKCYSQVPEADQF